MRKFLLAGLALIAATVIFAREPDDSTMAEEEMLRAMDSMENSFRFQTGRVPLPSANVVLNVPAGFKYLNSKDAKYVVEELWGNPPSTQAPLGLLLPADGKLLDVGGYAFIISYDALGFVKDGDAKDIDYDELMTNMQKDNIEENKEREQLGLSRLDLISWASKPFYDSEKKVLYWAKEYSVTGEEAHTLNYDVRVLGRRGVLTLQAVATMNDLANVNAHIPDVLSMVSFNEGSRYADVDEDNDHIAEWTIGGLVAGKVLAKVGFFAVIMKFLKLIILAVIGFGAAVWRWITGKKKKEKDPEYQYQPGLPEVPGSAGTVAELPSQAEPKPSEDTGPPHRSSTPIPPVS